jgi:hypothetical protein
MYLFFHGMIDEEIEHGMTSTAMAYGLRIEANLEAPLQKGKRVVRRRKATGQVNDLKVGLPKRGVVDLQGVGSQGGGAKIQCPGSCFFKENLPLTCFVRAINSAGGSPYSSELCGTAMLPNNS